MKSIIFALIILLMGGTLSNCTPDSESATDAHPVEIGSEGDDDTEVHAIEVGDFTIPSSGQEGSLSWSKSEVGENLEATPAVDDNNNVYVAGGDTMVSYDRNGNLRWSTTPIAGAILGESSSPSLSSDNSKVYLAAYAGIFAFDADNGEVLWEKRVPQNFPTIFATIPTVSADGTRLYVGAGDNLHPSDNFYSIDTNTGAIVWTYVLDREPLQSEDGSGIEGFLGGAIIHPNGSILIASQHGYLISLTDNGSDYTENWVFSIGAEMRQPPAVDSEGYILQASNLSRVEKIEPTTGQSVGGNWPVILDTGEIFTSVVLNGDGTIYTNTESGQLYAINSDGSIKWSLILKPWSSDPLVRNDGNILLVADMTDSGTKGHVVCIGDMGATASVVWATPIIPQTPLNETNVNLAPDGTLYVTGGEEGVLYALKGNGYGLSSSSPWPKAMHNIQNNGLAYKSK